MPQHLLGFFFWFFWTQEHDQGSLLPSQRPKIQLKRWPISLSSPLLPQHMPDTRKLHHLSRSRAPPTNAIFQRPLQLRLSSQVSAESYQGRTISSPPLTLPRKDVKKTTVWCGKQVSRGSRRGLRTPRYRAAFHTHKFSPSSPSGPAWVHLRNPCRCKG